MLLRHGQKKQKAEILVRLLPSDQNESFLNVFNIPMLTFRLTL